MESSSFEKVAVIIGAGPAGLTAAYELATKGIKPIVFEATDAIGGISQTINYKGNRIDIGGHRFFSKSDTVMDWWATFMPPQEVKSFEKNIDLAYRGQSSTLDLSTASANPDLVDNVMLVRSRLSRIYYLGKFFNYPVKLESQTVKNLGILRIIKIGFSYIRARILPLKEKSLEEFYINRFGRELYNTFFKSYTEKVWGVPVNEIAPDWGAQRVKGLSITKTLSHAFKSLLKNKRSNEDIRQKDLETSLIEYFLYPKFGPGQMWEIVAEKILSLGGEINMNAKVDRLNFESGKLKSVEVSSKTVPADFIISTMPINELVSSFSGLEVPVSVQEVAKNLPFRDFMTVGLLLSKLRVTENDGSLIKDNWIYIQEPDVEVGRLQIFNNWSPYLVADPKTVWVGLEYFVAENDWLWNMPDEEMANFGISELAKIGIIFPEDVLDHTVIRVKKTYPAYFGSYNQFDLVREFVDKIENLFLIGRNGMHRYNNQDHSMLTAMVAAQNIINGNPNKDNIWDVNVEQEYHEEK
jgi:protoporphyrinogen oxidase